MAVALGVSLLRPAVVYGASKGTLDLTQLTLHEAAARVRSRDVSPVELTRACLDRIERLDPFINAFITVSADTALADARSAEEEISKGRWRGPLHGMPIALKDNVDTAGIRTTAASAMFKDRVPAQDAEVVRRLKQAGAVILGKLNMWEFARSREGHWGPVRNPWAFDREAGFTSSGAGAAVAAGFCFGAIGTDAGGSVRLPAAACGIVGLKPTFGLVSNRGIVAGEGLVDHVGPLAKTLHDSALLLQALAGYDANWPDSVRVELPDYGAAIRERAAGIVLGVPKAVLDPGHSDPQVLSLFFEALDVMEDLATVRDEAIELPEYLDVVEGVKAEMLAYHAPLFERAPQLYSPSLRRYLRRELQRCVSGIDYVNARRALQEVRRGAASIFGGADLIVLPTWKRLPMPLDALERGDVGPARELWNTQPFNVLGLPAVSVPCGFTTEGLPVGVQIVGRPFSEPRLLAFAHAYEQSTSWHLRRPML